MTSKQITDTILMVRPAHFGFNTETAASNAFQSEEMGLLPEEINRRAIQEFDQFVAKLRDHGIRIVVEEDTPDPVKTDAVFPNNWITFHEDGVVITYPMLSERRRWERRMDIVSRLGERFQISRHLKLEHYELESLFLEGTGSIILDRPNRLAYACRSARTDEVVLDEFCRIRGYEKVLFDAVDAQGHSIYHTNVMMALAETFVVICLESLPNPAEQNLLRDLFLRTGKEVVDISFVQMSSFAGNMLQVASMDGEVLLVMSEQAYRSLGKEQVELIERHCRILYSPINVIEAYGGGSARCMMAEVFLPKRD